MQITRRKLFGIAALAAVGAVAGGARWERHLALVRPSEARPFTAVELSKAGPLGDESEGRADAPVTVIEYASMTCPHCANFDINVFPLIKSHYIDSGKVRYILREFPLDQLAAAARTSFSTWCMCCFNDNAIGWSRSRWVRCWKSPSRPASPSRSSTNAWQTSRS